MLLFSLIYGSEKSLTVTGWQLTFFSQFRSSGEIVSSIGQPPNHSMAHMFERTCAAAEPKLNQGRDLVEYLI